jgi:hypothetical protein
MVKSAVECKFCIFKLLIFNKKITVNRTEIENVIERQSVAIRLDNTLELAFRATPISFVADVFPLAMRVFMMRPLAYLP